MIIHKYLVPGKATLLRDFVFAADDGMLTTFAVIAGSVGASFSTSVIIALGLANVFADGFVIATGLYLGVKSELEVVKKSEGLRKSEGSPQAHGLITYVSFVIFGLLPILPFFTSLTHKFILSTGVVAVSLFLMGAIKTLYTRKNLVKSGLEVLLIGTIAALVAFAVGYLADFYLI